MVIEKVLALLAREQGARGARIAVNVSAVSLTAPRMLAQIERGLALHGVDPRRLVVEVTETAAISDMDGARAFCGGVLDLGCELALDDFGAGFGSFQYLKHLPFSYLKIDGGFIRGLTRSRTDQLVVEALAGVVRGMGRETIAEFVGDEPTAAMLRGYGIDYAQGFQVGRPGPRGPDRALAATASCGGGNCARIAASQPRLPSRRRVAIDSFADGVIVIRAGGRRRLIERSITFATRSGPPPRRRIGPS